MKIDSAFVSMVTTVAVVAGLLVTMIVFSTWNRNSKKK